VSNFNTSHHRYATASQILLNSEQVDCLIDSGAFKSFISEQYYKSRTFQIGKVTSNKRWVTANGNPIQVLGQTELNLQIGACNLNTTFIIAKNLAHDVLIGVDILKPNNFIINYETNTLTCNSYSIPIQTVTPVKTNLIHSTSSINLSPNTTTTIWIKYDIPNVNLFVNPLGKAKGFPTVVTTCNDGPTKIIFQYFSLIVLQFIYELIEVMLSPVSQKKTYYVLLIVKPILIHLNYKK
jgi:hypothetical protein